ncbi:carboxylesterase/lipase family protein [Nocardioides mesophilus]|uniref:Carboxylic ester hydrolase n=1 Tax=Nocardioides mesophilus TaxID=433659 RepID=A0A7G9R982_9ACTN|nr:carboxylesterase family protein [Nocardioides mesophilus]QNN52157.1 carboxylesterase/lipase family protein [Nocardioides mesophilus]
MEPVVSTRHGRVSGTVEDGVARFLGIPYAAPPVGERRFRAPEPPAPWDGIRPATALGATPPAPGYRAPIDQILYQPTVPGEDWLSVNVWTPDTGGDGLPVMVWIYGGAFSNGNAAIPMYDGTPFARDGVVLVTFNYRLGVEGFAALPDAPANRGLLDQLAALEWVADNIAAFGGDPDRVTIFGESAGAMSVTSLMAMPRARGLFARTITQSGAAQAAAEPADAALVTEALAQVLGHEASAAALSGVDPDTLVAAQRQVSDALALKPDPARFGPSIVASSMAFIPVVDGDLLPEHPLRALEAGASQDVPLLTGTTTEEFRFFVVPVGLAAAMTEEGLAAFAAGRGIEPRVLEVYRANRPGASPGDLLAALVTDVYFRRPMLAMVAARGSAPSWVYEFAWPSDRFDLGAAHAVDIPFVFDALQAKGASGLVGDSAPQSLAEEMHASWVRFATTGDPGWRSYDERRTVRVFDAAGGREVEDPRGDERAVW